MSKDVLANISYEDLRKSLGELPVTWYPDLIRAMVQAAIKKGVFLKGGATRFVAQVEKDAPGQVDVTAAA